MYYLLERRDTYYYSKRVPKAYRAYDPREYVRISLGTRNREQALLKAAREKEKLSQYWATLVQTGAKHDAEHYKTLVDRANQLGFTYLPNDELAALVAEQIIQRLAHVEKHQFLEPHVDAVLGGHAPPAVMLDDVLAKFWAFAKDKTINKSPDQVRKWRNPRIKAMRNFIACVGNKAIHELTRQDMLCFRDWWIERIREEEVTTNTANKDIIYVKTILTTVADNCCIKLDKDHLFGKLKLAKGLIKKRLPFDSIYLISTLLNPINLSGLNVQARCALLAFSETGAGFSELVGLLPEDIILDHEIPHIIIRPRTMKELKTPFRERTIPLVGYALEAFNECPEGFTQYRECPDILSNTVGKYLRENNLYPTDQHTVYSLRHSFQDRLLAEDTPDRIQADLMGHKFQRPQYGNGATLAHKMEYMEKIRLKRE